MSKSANFQKHSFLKVLFKKHKIETFIFIGCLITVFWLELTAWRFQINSTINFNKLNSLISTFAFAYIASYIFWFTNYFVKYIKDIRIIYSQLRSITSNLFSVYDAYIHDLSRFYNIPLKNGEEFTLNEDSLNKIIKHSEENKVQCKSLCGANYQTASQIDYDIELLLKYSTYLDAPFLSMIMNIGRNLFIIQHKVNIRDLFIFECTQQSVIELSEQVNDLRKYAEEEFCISNQNVIPSKSGLRKWLKVKGFPIVIVALFFALFVIAYFAYLRINSGELIFDIINVSATTLIALAVLFISWITYTDSKEGENAELLKELLSVVKDMRDSQNASLKGKNGNTPKD